MNPKKAKEKERRRARKLADEAWEAANAQNLDLAEKIIRRATATQPDNPVLWNDQGMILLLRNQDGAAEEAFRAALSLVPTFAESYAQLAAMRARQGYPQAAIPLMEQAVKHAPSSALYAQRLEAYRVLAGQQVPAPTEQSALGSLQPDQADRNPPGSRFPRLAEMDWDILQDRLTRDGAVLLPELLDGPTCDQLAGMFDDDSQFAKTVVMDNPDFGEGVYRYFRDPIPGVVDALRQAVYIHVAPMANAWQTMLNEPDRFPDDWEGFRQICQEAGQTTPTPILLRYGPGGFNALHRDLRGSVYFPIQMAVVLSNRADPADPDAAGFSGGDFLLADVPKGKKSRCRAFPAGKGDSLLFCTRDRLVRLGDAYGSQPVKHGVSSITAGSRVVLGVPFHEYR